MESPSPQSRDNERDSGESGSWAGVQSQSSREQSYHSVLGDGGRNYYLDLLHNKLHEYNTDQHHHHSGDNNILIHAHEYDETDSDHKHDVTHGRDYDDGCCTADHEATYGPASHTHNDTTGTPEDRNTLNRYSRRWDADADAWVGTDLPDEG